jgi:taurine dioxygenase
MSFIKPIAETAAVEIAGIDCALPPTDAVVQMINRAFRDHPVLILRNQSLSAASLAAFSRSFGELEVYAKPSTAEGDNRASQPVALRQIDQRDTPDQTLYLHPDQPDVLIMSNECRPDLTIIGIVDNAETWHADGSHRSDPYKAILLHAERNPEQGGDTEFCDLRAAYDALPPDLKAMLDGQTASHHWSKSRNPRFAASLDPQARAAGEQIADAIAPVRHPIVRTHETGRKSLFISPRFTLHIDGLAPDVSESLLSALFAFAEQPRFVYRHQWQDNDLVIWDNRCLNHRVRGFSTTDLRRRSRVTVSGDRPV